MAQTIPVRGDVGANMERHLRLAQVAAAARAHVLVFPELSLTGYELDLAGDLAFSEGDSRLTPLVEAASSASLILIVGAPVRIESRLHIGAFIVYPDGTLGLYTKHHLGTFSAGACSDGTVPPAEATVFHPGDRNPLVRIGSATAAVAVCADAGRPSHPQKAAQRGAGLYLGSMFIIPSELEREFANLAALSGRHSMAVAVANYGGPSGGLASAGRSAIWSEQGSLLVRLESTGSGVAVATGSHAGWRARAIMLRDV